MKSLVVGLFLVSLSVTSSFVISNFGFDPDEIDLSEGQDPIQVGIGSINNSPFPAAENVKCLIDNYASFPPTLRVKLPNQPWQSANSLPFFVIHARPGVLPVQYRAEHDRSCEDQKYFVQVVCFRDSILDTPALSITTPKLVINVLNTESASMCNDPHLTQKVNGVDENDNQVTKNVCYDLFGKAGDQMELMTDKILGTSIVFELRDDYYIGKIFYATKLGYFNFTTTKMTSEKWIGSLWGKEGKVVVGESSSYPHAIITQNKEDILIDYNEEHRSQSIRIAKIQQDYGKSYLNVLIEKSSNHNGVFDEFHGGIFGLIANQKYEFYHAVQDSGSPTVRVNGRIVKTSLKDKSDRTDGCYSMSLEDLLYPKNAEFFQKSL